MPRKPVPKVLGLVDDLQYASNYYLVWDADYPEEGGIIHQCREIAAQTAQEVIGGRVLLSSISTRWRSEHEWKRGSKASAARMKWLVEVIKEAWKADQSLFQGRAFLYVLKETNRTHLAVEVDFGRAALCDIIAASHTIFTLLQFASRPEAGNLRGDGLWGPITPLQWSRQRIPYLSPLRPYQGDSVPENLAKLLTPTPKKYINAVSRKGINGARTYLLALRDITSQEDAGGQNA